jgi:hypothetical protein
MLVFHAWLDSEFFFPMTKRDIQLIQEKIGAYPDGVWGPMSRAACQKHLDRLRPVPVQWPMQDDQSLIAFYGQPGDESNLVNLSVADLGVHYESQAVKTIRCHTRVASSLHRVLTAISKTHPYVLKQYGGCFNDRNMRGGSRKSLHAWGAAIDLMASFQPLTTLGWLRSLQPRHWSSRRRSLLAGQRWHRIAWNCGSDRMKAR